MFKITQHGDKVCKKNSDSILHFSDILYEKIDKWMRLILFSVRTDLSVITHRFRLFDIDRVTGPV